jgi:hypothetical protein
MHGQPERDQYLIFKSASIEYFLSISEVFIQVFHFIIIYVLQALVLDVEQNKPKTSSVKTYSG